MSKHLASLFPTLIVVLALFTSGGAKVCAQETDFPFIIVTSDTVKSLPPLSDKEFYDKSTGVIFMVSKTNIRPDDPFFELYREEILPRVNSEHLQLRKIFIRGAASPEGRYAFNKYLSRARSRTLLNELQQGLRFQYLTPEIDMNNVTEDYGHLCILMEEANDADYPIVKKIFDDCNGDEVTCKKELMATQGGTLWARLLKEYFPKLRSARMILWFSLPDIYHAPISPVTVTPEPFPEFKMEEPPFNGWNIPQVEGLGNYYTRRHLIAVRTNLLHDAFYMPQFGWAPSTNVQLEYYPLGGHYTYNVGMTWGTHRHWDTQEFFQVRDFQFELRRYFRGGGDFTGLYLSAYAHGNKYGIGLDQKKGWEGEGGGAGLSLGYVVPLNKKGNFRLEFMAAAGYYLTLFDPYVYGNPVTGTVDGYYYYNYYGNASSFKKRNHRFSWIGPTNFGIQLTYDIIYRKRQKAQKGDAL